ncbi:calcium/sodium antiporter [Psychroflexus aestuariivivens]|uniref:calcium/sodium antiporter n=1 Tax=Psychroflexus aestuariivivens TaxID=1795040 RepID=UPI000FDC4D86|nr:calcium/sodium antiporter [Psychroflexus aestuariivivens]
MLVSILLICLGFVLLIKGADWMVRGASTLAKQYNISDLSIGLTIVAFGTSAPELVVNLVAASQDQPDIVFGNIIGSNNFNLFVILGIVAIIAPIGVKSSTVWKEIPISAIAVLVLFLLANSFLFSSSSEVSRLDALVLLVVFAGFLFYVFQQMKNDKSNLEVPTEQMSRWKITAYIVAGLAGLIFGGQLVVNNATEIATHLGVSQKIIGLTIVAVGTSLPELVTSVVAALKKNSDIAIGNVVGSNIFNFLLVIPLSALLNPLAFNTEFNTDLYLLFGGTLFLFVAMFTGGKKKLDRWEALVLLGSFIAYTSYLVYQAI